MGKASIESATGQDKCTMKKVRSGRKNGMLLLLNNLLPTSKIYPDSFVYCLLVESVRVPALPLKNCNPRIPQVERDPSSPTPCSLQANDVATSSTDFWYTCVLLGWPAGTREIKAVRAALHRWLYFFLLCAYETSYDFYIESNDPAYQE